MHVDPELLCLLALDEHAGSEADRSHVAGCPTCAGELAELRGLVGLGRDAGPAPLAVPSGAVWARIHDELFPPPPGPDRSRAVGHAALVAVGPSWADASATADIATDEHGRRILRLALTAELPAAGLRQAWLVHRADPGRRQTIGILDGLHGVWTIDHSIDLTDYAILEVSQQEPGDQAYSGDTVVRGELALIG